MFELARVGLGALGILTTVTFAVEPLFLLEAHEQPMSWDEALGAFDDMAATADHCDMYWFPHTDRMLTKRNTRLDTDVSLARPLSARARVGRRRAPPEHRLRRPHRRRQPGAAA